MWKDGCYDGKDTNELAGLECFHKAYREIFLIVRTRLPKKVYNLIPNDLTVKINKGIVPVRDLYQIEAGSGLYVLDKNIKFTSREVRELQMTIAPHLFWELHHF